MEGSAYNDFPTTDDLLTQGLMLEYMLEKGNQTMRFGGKWDYWTSRSDDGHTGLGTWTDDMHFYAQFGEKIAGGQAEVYVEGGVGTQFSGPGNDGQVLTHWFLNLLPGGSGADTSYLKAGNASTDITWGGGIRTINNFSDKGWDVSGAASAYADVTNGYRDRAEVSSSVEYKAHSKDIRVSIDIMSYIQNQGRNNTFAQTDTSTNGTIISLSTQWQVGDATLILAYDIYNNSGRNSVTTFAWTKMLGGN